MVSQRATQTTEQIFSTLMSLMNSESSKFTEKVFLSSELEETKMHRVISEAEKTVKQHLYFRV